MVRIHKSDIVVKDFSELFPTDPKEPFEYVYTAVSKRGIFVVKLGDGILLKPFSRTYTEKMTKKHTSFLKQGMLNHLIFEI